MNRQDELWYSEFKYYCKKCNIRFLNKLDTCPNCGGDIEFEENINTDDEVQSQ